jgi:two-component system, OmpR family, KDP operon response regulator KdpE
MIMTNEHSILVIDDEPQIRRLLQLTFEASGYKVLQAATGEEGLIRAGMDRPELIVLDLGLPDADGIDILKKLRKISMLPIVILSVRDAEDDIIRSLESGADDYVTKPFRTGELLARVHAALRHRTAEPTAPVIVAGSLEVNLDARTVKKNGELIKLTATEYSLLALFVRNAGRVLTHRYILEQVWGPVYAEETHYSRVYVGQLRKKLESDPSKPVLIVTESGIGYRFTAA